VEKGKTKQNIGIQSIIGDNKVIMNQNKIENTFNKYFLSIANSIISDNNKHISSSSINPITYLVNTSIFSIFYQNELAVCLHL
jgi:hypothetical protein